VRLDAREKGATDVSAGGEDGGDGERWDWDREGGLLRTMLRRWLRVMPVARSRPISRVRSTTESESVLATPSTPMMAARASSAKPRASSVSI
jgi:hypothetical protein